MSAEAPILTRSWRVGPYTATLTVPQAKRGALASAVVEWSPDVPKRLTAAEIEQYRCGRDKAIAELGLRTLLVEL